MEIPDEKWELIRRCDDLNEFEELTGEKVGCWDMEHTQDCEIEGISQVSDSTVPPTEG